MLIEFYYFLEGTMSSEAVFHEQNNGLRRKSLHGLICVLYTENHLIQRQNYI